MKKIFIFILFLIFSVNLFSEEKETLQKRPVGTEFWLCFMKNFIKTNQNEVNNLKLELFITGDEDAEVIIEIEKLKYRKKIDLPGGTVKNIKLDPGAEIQKFGEIIEGMSVHITSDNPISVYGLNTRYQTTDTYLGLPVNVLGNEYRIMSYHVAGELKSVFGIVATEDSTIVSITPTVETSDNNQAGKPYVIYLNKGDIYQGGAKVYTGNSIADLTGTLISSTKKIAVFGGHQCAYVPVGPPRIIACNHLVEQLPPISSWGKHFYLGKMEKRSKFTYRVLAHKNETKLFIDGSLTATLQAGEYFEAEDNMDLNVTADKPVLVSQYSQGYKNGDLIGDPMMLLISPTQQFLNKYRFATPINGSWDHYINVVVPTDHIDSLFLDSKKIDKNQFKELGLSRYSIAYIKIPYGTHYIRCTAPFGLYSYGFGFGEDAYDAYGTMGGQSFLEYVDYKDTQPPVLESDGMGSLVFRDDRVDDSGLLDIQVISKHKIKVDEEGSEDYPIFGFADENIMSEIPKFSEGAPFAQLNIKAINTNQPGKIVFRTTDLFNNTAYYTVCYKYDKFQRKLIYDVTEGKNVSCSKIYKYEFGVFGKISQNYHDADFAETGIIAANGRFSEASGTGGLFGFSLTRNFNSKFSASLNLSFDTYSATLTAADSVVSSIRDFQNGGFIDFQEASDLNMQSLYMHSMFTAEYHFNRLFYGFGGFNTAILLDNNVKFNKRIIVPNGYVYDNNQSTKTEYEGDIQSLCGFRLGLVAGLGLRTPLTDRIIFFSNLLYTYHLGNIVDDGNWTLYQLSLMIGAKYTF